MRHFFIQYGLYLFFCENFTTNVTLDKEVPATFEKSSGARVQI